jgi:hypothetical protein
LAPADLARHLARHTDCGADPRCAAELLAGYDNDRLSRDGELEAARRRLVDHFLGRDEDRRRLQKLRENGVHVEFIVATIADYVDSNSGWLADQQIEAIQASMAVSGYTLDRFYLPDWTPAAGAVQSSSRRHETEPGAIIFKRLNSNRQLELRVVLLATETPTSGIHERAFVAAARLVTSWEAPNRSRVPWLRVLGPTFSGSIPTLRRAIGTAASEQVQSSVRVARVVSGSANANDNRDILTAQRGTAGTITFDSTVTPSGEVIDALKAYLKRMNANWARGCSVAILHESNTAFGSQTTGLPSPSSGSTSCEEERGVAGNPSSVAAIKGQSELVRPTLRTAFPSAMLIPFPLHISRLRHAAAGPTATKLFGRYDKAFGLGDATTATDRLPPLNPDIAAATSQTAVAMIVDRIRRGRFQAVGILATDERDVVYLARELRRASPDVQLFLMGSHVLYLHPDYGPYTRGAIVASTYSLFTPLQQWASKHGSSRDDARLQQFPSMVHQGLFNALQLLMDGDDRRLADYCDPSMDSATEAKSCHPPVWVSVVGRTGFWPLAFVTPIKNGWSYVKIANDASVTVLREPDRQRLGAIGAALAFVGTLLWHLYAVFAQFRGGLRPAASAVSQGVARTCRAPRTQLVANLKQIASAAAEEARPGLQLSQECARRSSYVGVFTAPTGPAARRTAHTLQLWVFALLGVAGLCLGSVFVGGARAAIAGGSLVVWLAIPLVLEVARRCYQELTRSEQSSRLTLSFIFSSAIGPASLVALALAACWPPADPLQRRLALERAVALQSLVSPIVPVVLLLSAGYVWAFWQLARLSQLGIGYCQLLSQSAGLRSLVTARLQAGGQASDASDREAWMFADLADRPLRGLLARSGSVAAGGVALGALAVFVLILRDVHTVEGSAFTWLLRVFTAAGWALMLFSLAYTYTLWQEVRRVLVRLNLSPVADSFEKVGAFKLDWKLNVGLPRWDELIPLVTMVDEIAPGAKPFRARLQEEGGRSPRIALLHSRVFGEVWHHLERYTAVLEGCRWVSDAWSVRLRTAVAFLLAFLIRDLVARVLTGLAAVTISLFLILGAHLFYTFPGRSIVLTVDWILIAATSLCAIRVLVEMERDAVLSRLWGSTPGKVTFNSDFVGRVALYGALPVLTLVSALFPEVGDTLFAWLAPARQMVGF